MRVTLLGTGDSTGTPTPGCTCATCRRAVEQGIERTRFSVHVRNEQTGEALLVDCSPDFRHQFLTHDVALPEAAVITHIHFDHLDGLGNAYRLFEKLDVYAADAPSPAVAEHVADRYAYLDCVTVHPRSPETAFEVCSFKVTLLPVDHPPLPTFGVLLEGPDATMAITGDTTYDLPSSTKRALAEADLLLADAIVPAAFCEGHPAGGAHYTEDGRPRTFGTKHMTRAGATDLVDELNPERARLVHCSHFYSPSEAFGDPLAIDGECYTI